PAPPCPTLFPYTTLFRSSTLINVTGAKLSAVNLLDLSGSGTFFDLGSGSLATTAGGTLEIGAGTSVVFANDAKLKTTGDLFSLRSEEHTSELQSRSDLVC